jgi:hypothetical protein
MPQLDVNWLAIIVAAIVAFGLGALWYSRSLFGRQWMAAHGHTPEQLAAMQANMGKTYAVSFVTYLIMAMVIALLMGLTGVQGIVLAVLAWLGFGFTIGLNTNLYTNKPSAAFMIDAGYQLVHVILMGAIIGAWR